LAGAAEEEAAAAAGGVGLGEEERAADDDEAADEGLPPAGEEGRGAAEDARTGTLRARAGRALAAAEAATRARRASCIVFAVVVAGDGNRLKRPWCRGAKKKREKLFANARLCFAVCWGAPWRGNGAFKG
jgi:hypothetical protein